MSDHLKGRTALEREASSQGADLPLELAHALVRSSLDGILAFDRDLRYTLWNPAMERLSGVPANRVLGRVAFEVFPFLLELGEDHAFREALAGRHTVTRERPFTIAETGRQGFFEGSYSPLRNASGEIVGGLGMIRDVTERKRAEAARFKAEEAGRKLSLLAEVGRELSASLDFEHMLQRLAGLVVPELADYSIVDIFTEQGDIRRAAVAHRTAAGRALLLELQRHPPSLGSPEGVGLVMRTGEPLLVTELKEGQFRAAAHDEEQFRLFSSLGAKSCIIVPLLAHGRVLGSLALAITEGDRHYGAADLTLAEELAQRAALALDNARLFEAAQRARDQAESAARRTAFLAEAGAVLASSLDYATTFAMVSDLAVPRLADWCVIDLLEPDGSLHRIRTGHVDPARMELAEDFQRRYPFDPTAPGGLARVLRTGQPEFYPEITDQLLIAAARDPEQLRLLRELRFTSIIMVPLLARDRVLGAVTLISTESGRRYGPEDLVLVRELAARAAIAMENARLYQETQEAARRLGDNVALLDALLVSAPVGIAFLDKELRFARINAVMAELIGIDSAAVTGRLYGEILPDLAPSVSPQHLRVLERGEPVTGLEVSGETPAAPGKRRHFLANYYPIRSRDGSTAGMGAAVVEITERKHAEEALRETNQTLRALIQSCPLAVMVLEPENGTVQLWNPAAERIFGWAEGEVLGRTLPIVPEDRRDEFRRHLQALKDGESLLGVETVRQTRDGSPVHVSLWVAPVSSPGGMRILGMLADVTERKRILDERQRLEEELRRRVGELAAADRRKDEFLAMLAHELRNPLAAISNAGYVLGNKGSLDPRSTELLAMVGRQIRHLSRLVDDLLDVSRFSRGLIELRKAPMELRRAVDGAVETARPHVEQRRHTLEVALPDEPLWLEADITRIEQVLANLLHNAAKYTPSGGLIQLAAERQDGEAVLRVRDNGAGISADLLPQIFDLFVQEERSLDRSQGGLGIGLTLVRSLVERHGGRVAVASEGPGQGTEFTVRLPLSDPPDIGASSQEGKREDAGPRTVRALLVEDNLDAAEALGELLRMWGHEVHIAHDGPSALHLAEKERPDVLLLDIGLPGMDGYEVARRLRSTPGFAGVKLIALTGYGQEADRQRSGLAGFDHHLVKPVDLEQLRALLTW